MAKAKAKAETTPAAERFLESVRHLSDAELRTHRDLYRGEPEAALIDQELRSRRQAHG